LEVSGTITFMREMHPAIEPPGATISKSRGSILVAGRRFRIHNTSSRHGFSNLGTHQNLKEEDATAFGSAGSWSPLLIAARSLGEALANFPWIL
jgi:hypothetical protein